MTVVFMAFMLQCISAYVMSPGLRCISVCVCMHVHILLSVFCHPSYSEPVEENPYRPTYIFPESYDRPLKTRGTINSRQLFRLLTLTLSTFPSHSAWQVLTRSDSHCALSSIFKVIFLNIADKILKVEKINLTESNTNYIEYTFRKTLSCKPEPSKEPKRNLFL